MLISDCRSDVCASDLLAWDVSRMMDLFRHIGAAVAALFLLFGLTSHARADKRVEVRPYLELDQVVVADLKGASNAVLTSSRSHERRAGNERVRTCLSRRPQYRYNNNKNKDEQQ